VEKTEQFLREDISALYDFDLYRKYESIIKLTDDNAIAVGAKENRLCHAELSRLQKIKCGHYAFSVGKQRACGLSCEVLKIDGQPFFCMLCARQQIHTRRNTNRLNASTRWHDMLLPTHGDTD
jgi:hypothetical protein